MADPFLAAHELTPNQYDLSGRYVPGSIRDQMIRGYLLIERLFEHGRLGPGSRLLIVGAGAGGVTAGICAAERGAVVSIVEQEERPFKVQRDVSSRWICPTQYDWPVDHWERGTFPWDGSAMPLDWDEGRASDVATVWTEQLSKAETDLADRLKVFRSTEYISANHSNRLVAVELKNANNVRSESFDVVVLCHGFGGESTRISGYAGPTFWRKGHPAWTGKGSTLVVGGGDGALQDFLLLTTGAKSARDLLRALLRSGSQRSDIEAEVHSAEDQAQRAAVWTSRKVHDHEIFIRLEAVHQTIIDRIAEDSEVFVHLWNLLNEGNPDVRIVHSCSHFGRAYALNRFLVLLVIRGLKIRNISARKMAVRVEHVLSADPSHSCGDDPELCYGFRHDARYQRSNCLGTGVPDPEPHPFERVVIRGGPSPEVDPCRQTLPYHLYSISR